MKDPILTPFLAKKAFILPPLTVDGMNNITTATDEEINAFIVDMATCANTDYQSALNHYQNHLKDYLLGKHLKNHLSLVQKKWHERPQEEKAMLALKLHEEIGECTPGFVNRVLWVVQYLYNPPFHIDSLLLQMRRELVERAALTLSDDVHHHNRCFRVAAEHGYGVRSHSDDIYTGNFTDGEILQCLQTTIQEHYHPLSIIHYLVEALQSLFRTKYGYNGLMDLDTPYPYRIYNEWAQVMSLFFCNDDQTDNGSLYDALIINDEKEPQEGPLVIDINWPWITYRLFNHLETDYFQLSPAVSDALSYLLNPAIPYDEDKKTAIEHFFTTSDFIKTDEWLIDLLLLIQNQDKRKQLWDKYIEQGEAPEDKKRTLLAKLLRRSASIPRDELLLTNIQSLPSPTLSELCLKSEKQLLSLYQLLQENHLEPKAIDTLAIFFDGLTNPQERLHALLYLFSSNRVSKEQLTVLYHHKLAEGIKSKLFESSYFAEQFNYKPISHIQLYIKGLGLLTTNLSSNEQYALLKQVNNRGYNVLMEVVLFFPVLFDGFIPYIQKLSERKQLELLKQKAPYPYTGYDVLALATCYPDNQCSAIKKIFEVIKALSIENQRTFLTQMKSKQRRFLIERLGQWKPVCHEVNYINVITNRLNRCEFLKVIKEDVHLLKYADAFFQHDIDVALEAIQKDNNTFDYFLGSLKENTFLQHLGNLSDEEQKKRFIDQYKTSDAYKKARTISNVEQYILQRKKEQGGQGLHWFRGYASLFFTKNKARLISAFYSGQQKIQAAEQLIRFLKGESVSFTEPEKKALQDGRLKKTHKNLFFMENQEKAVASSAVSLTELDSLKTIKVSCYHR